MTNIQPGSIDEAEQLLERITPMSEMIIRGDRPYNFEARQLLNGFVTARAVYFYLAQQLEDQPDRLMHRAGLHFGRAGNYMRALAREAKAHPDTPAETHVLLELHDLIHRYVSERIDVAELRVTT